MEGFVGAGGQAVWRDPGPRAASGREALKAPPLNRITLIVHSSARASK